MGEFSAAAYKAAKKYADDTLKGLGAIKGSPCTIKSITEGEDGATIVFAWTGSDGVEQTETAFVRRGPQGDPGAKGDPGVSPTVTVSNITDGHRVTVTDAAGTRSFDVLNGKPGKDGSGVDAEARAQIAALSEEIGDVQFHAAMPEGVVGDGVTDDSAAIQALLDNNDYVYLPKGTYYIAAKWLEMLRDNVTFICDGTLLVNTTQALVLSASHCNIKIAHIKCKYNGTWTEADKWKFITSAIKLHATTAAVMYNTIEVGYIERCINGFWLVPDGEGLGIAHNTIKFGDVLAERGIYFNPGDQEYVFINGNHFYGGQLRGNHPIYTQKGANQSDPFNGNTFNHVAMEGCQKPMTLNCFYMNKFADMRVIDSENRQLPYPEPLIVFDEESFGNVIETHATLCVDRIVDPEKSTAWNWARWLGNLYLPKVLTTGEQSVALALGTRGRTIYGCMIVNGDWHMVTAVKNTNLDLSADKYAVIGRTFECVADTGNVVITLPMGYRQKAATEFYVYVESITSPYTIKVMQDGVDIIPDTVMTETGLYKAELITSVGWVVTKVDVAYRLPEESLPEIVAGTTTE